MSLVLQSLEACAAMAVSDTVSTLLTVAEARGSENLAGVLDPLGTAARMVFYSYDGVTLLHGHGAWGLVAMLPIFCVDFFTTKYSTRFSKRIKAKAEGTDAG